MGPRFLVRTAGLEMHPIDQADRRGYLKDVGGAGYCNITKCCTEVCPEHIKITDNAIIPLKERVADEFYDPLRWAWRKLRGTADDTAAGTALPVLTAPADDSAGSVHADVSEPIEDGDPGSATLPPAESIEAAAKRQ